MRPGRGGRRRPLLALVLWLLWGWLAAGPAGAHTGGTTGFATITVNEGTVRYALTLASIGLPPAIAEDIRRAGTDPPSRERLVGLLRRRVAMSLGGERCMPLTGFVQPSPHTVESTTVVLDFACPGMVTRLEVRDDVFDDLGRDHHTLAKVELPTAVTQFAFAPDARTAAFIVEPTGVSHPGAGQFFLLGVEHILTGYDHLLFLLALLLGGGTALGLLKTVTAFTVAHSLTLGLAVLGLARVPSFVVEPVIAASIAYVAVENAVATRGLSRRWVVSFVFGLVHGFGFASVLAELDLPARNLAGALLGFNLGVEAGQTLVIALTLPALMWVRGRAWEPRLVRVLSGGLAVVGGAWCLERLLVR